MSTLRFICFLICLVFTYSEVTVSTSSNSTIPAGFSCVSSSSCNNNGYCNGTRCICNNNFATSITPNATNPTMCNYEMKSQKTAFFLSLFVGFGSEHFYLGNPRLGIAKLFFYLFFYLLNIIMLATSKLTDKYNKYLECIGTTEFTYLTCGIIAVFLWNLFDLVNLGQNTYVDGSGFPLAPWN